MNQRTKADEWTRWRNHGIIAEELSSLGTRAEKLRNYGTLVAKMMYPGTRTK